MKKALLFFPLLLLIFNSTLICSQVKLKTHLPLENKVFSNATSLDSLTLNQVKKPNGLILIFSANSCPFVVGSENFPGWEAQYNELFLEAEKLNIGCAVVNSNASKRDGDDSFTKMIEHAKEKGYLMPYLLDKNSELANSCAAKTTPHVFFYNGDLSLIYTGSIDNIWDKERKATIPYLKDAMRANANNNKIKTSQTPPKGCSIKRNI
jgi:thioredoxin-related protein